MNAVVQSDASAAERLPEVVKLEECVRAKLGGRLRSFWIDVDDAGLLLRGRAPTYYVKCLAQHVVMEATTTPIAANRIEVSPPDPKDRS